jgi:hypothetical protein
MNWEMENSVGRLMQKKEGDGQLGYNKQKNLDLNSNLVM